MVVKRHTFDGQVLVDWGSGLKEHCACRPRRSGFVPHTMSLCSETHADLSRRYKL